MSRLEEDEGTYDIIEHSPCAVNQHSIILIKKKLNDDDRFCEVCKGLILGPFYSCDQCHLFVHETCRKLPKKMQHESTDAGLPSLTRHLLPMEPSVVRLVEIFGTALPTGATHVTSILTYNVFQSRKLLIMKVMNTHFSWLYVLKPNHAKLVIAA